MRVPLKIAALFALLFAGALQTFAQSGGYRSPAGGASWQNQGVTLGTPAVLNCSTNMSCSYANGVVTLTASATGATAFSGLTAAANTSLGTFSASGNSWDFTGTALFKLRVAAGLTTTVNGDIGYDSTAGLWHAWIAGGDHTLLYTGGPGGTPSSLVLTNATGLPIGGLTGLGAGVAAALAAAVNGTGSICMTTSCSMTTPALGTPSAINLANASNLPAALVTADIQGLTGCNTVGNVFTPQGSDCVAPGGSSSSQPLAENTTTGFTIPTTDFDGNGFGTVLMRSNGAAMGDTLTDPVAAGDLIIVANCTGTTMFNSGAQCAAGTSNLTLTRGTSAVFYGPNTTIVPTQGGSTMVVAAGQKCPVLAKSTTIWYVLGCEPLTPSTGSSGAAVCGALGTLNGTNFQHCSSLMNAISNAATVTGGDLTWLRSLIAGTGTVGIGGSITDTQTGDWEITTGAASGNETTLNAENGISAGAGVYPAPSATTKTVQIHFKLGTDTNDRQTVGWTETFNTAFTSDPTNTTTGTQWFGCQVTDTATQGNWACFMQSYSGGLHQTAMTTTATASDLNWHILKAVVSSTEIDLYYDGTKIACTNSGGTGGCTAWNTVVMNAPFSPMIDSVTNTTSAASLFIDKESATW